MAHHPYDCGVDEPHGAGDGETPSQMILVVGQRRHVGRVAESWLSGLVVVESGE